MTYKWGLGLLLLAACTGKQDDSAIDSLVGFCSDVPLQTYDNFGQGFMTENCQVCHASSAINHYFAPEDVYFDTKEDCWRWKDRILARSAGDDATMPPNGGVTEDDRIRLRWWLECAPEGL